MTAYAPLDRVDEALAAWDERLRRMDENLVALEGDATYQFLAGHAGKRATLEGATKAAVDAALDGVTELFENRERLGALVAKAKEIREDISFWGRDEKIAEIRALLTGPSIELGQRIVALRERSLLAEGTQDLLIEPEKLLAAMAQRFEEARTTLVAVSQAWEALEPVLSAVEAEATALSDLAAEIAKGQGQAPDVVELQAVRRELERARALVARDPLGAKNDVDRVLRPKLGALRARLDADVAARARALSAVAGARELRAKLAEVHERVGRDAATLRAELAGAVVPKCVDDALLVGLDEWLTKLEATVARGRWSSAEVGLGRWRATAEQYLASDQAAANEARAWLERASELHGRLSARRAQATALAARGLPIDPAYQAWAEEAERLLRERPLRLTEAAHAVDTFEAGVRALANRRGA